MNPLHLIDGYKAGHRQQYPAGTTLVYSNFTPRKNRNPMMPKTVFFGLQYFIKEYLQDRFDREFFHIPKERAVRSYKRRMDSYLGKNAIPIDHIEALHDLGYLPLKIKALPEGSMVDMKIPVLTIVNTKPDFFWLVNYIETLMSCVLWQPSTSATIAKKYREILDYFAKETGGDENFVQWQGHDFSFRGMSSVETAMVSGAGHLLSFTGTDTVPAIDFLEKYYGASCEVELIGGSVSATEHSVMCAGGKENEMGTFERLITEVYPSGIVSVVSDSWNFWKVVTEYLPHLKEKIMARDGKLVIRPDSGDPVDILCGTTIVNGNTELRIAGNDPEYIRKGLIECLWDTFGGTINEKGFKQLDPHIGAIYGDSITIDRCNEICMRLKEKGYASTNVVFGIGSFTYQYNTRDTFGWAMKATYVEREDPNDEIHGYAIFKDPMTDDGTKKSARGLINVERRGLNYQLHDNQTWDGENEGSLRVIFEDGELIRETTLAEIRARLAKY